MNLYRKIYYPGLIMSALTIQACSHHVSKPLQKIHIDTYKNVKVISVDSASPVRFARHQQPCDCRPTHTSKINSEQYYVTRSNKPLRVIIEIDSVRQTIYISPRSNYGRFLNMKYVFRKRDSLNTCAYKRWIYPRKNFIAISNTGISATPFAPVKPGTVRMTISPGVQIFNVKTDSGRRVSAGIVGAEMGADYFYASNKFLSFTIGAATDVIPLPIDYFGAGYIERSSVIYTSVRNNIMTAHFDIGYGLSLSRLYWTAIPHGDSLLPERRIRTTGLGLSLSAHYQLKRNLRFGIIYQPSLLNISQTNAFSYQDCIGIHATWSFGGRRRK